MKNFWLLGLLLLCCMTAQSQDIILKTNGEEIRAKVMEVSSIRVQYILPVQEHDSVHILTREEVFMITYANGKKEVLAGSAPEEKTPTAQFYQLGKQEAKLFYKGNDALVMGAVGTVLLSIPGTMLAAALPIKIKRSEVSNITYLSNADYIKGYKKQANKRKIGKVALGGGLVLGTYVVLAAAFLSSQ